MGNRFNPRILINGSSITLGAGAGSVFSSGVFELPYATSTGLPATSTQVLESGSNLSLMAGQTIVMIALFHDRHGPGSTSLPTGTATVATSSLTLSSAGVLQASETAAVVPSLSTLSSAIIIASLGTATVAASSVTLPSTSATSASAATNTNDCGVVQSFYGQTAANWDAIDMDAWLNTWFNNYSSEISANSYGFAG